MWADEEILVLKGDAEQVETLYNALLKVGMKPFNLVAPENQEQMNKILAFSEEQDTDVQEYAGTGNFEFVQKVLTSTLELFRKIFSGSPDGLRIKKYPSGEIQEVTIVGNGAVRRLIDSGYLDKLESFSIPVEGHLVSDVPKLRERCPRNESE